MDDDRELERVLRILLILSGVAIAFFLILYFAHFSRFSDELSSDPQHWGLFGDYLGGTLGTVFSFLAFIGLFLTIRLQRNQLRQAQNALAVAQRPWVSVRIEVGSALTYSADGWHIVLDYELKNVGTGPATGVDVYAKMFPGVIASVPKNATPERMKEVLERANETAAELAKLVDGATSMHKLRMGFARTVFPGEDVRGQFNIHGNGPEFGIDKVAERGSYTGQFTLLFCVAYGVTFDETRHATAKAYVLFKAADAAGRFGNIELKGEQIERDGLRFAPFPDSKTDVVT
jgi:hypothetical protein